MGIIFWSATAGICFFSFLISKNRKEVLFYLIALIFTTLLLIDDFFMFHDVIFPIFGINEFLIYIIYAILAVLFVVFLRSTIFLTPFYFLFIALFFLGLSVSFDVVLHYIELANDYFYEDTAKFIGIANWWIYFFIRKLSHGKRETKILTVKFNSDLVHSNFQHYKNDKNYPMKITISSDNLF